MRTPATVAPTENRTAINGLSPIAPGLGPWPGVVQALNRQVIRVHIHRRFEPGTLLVLTLENDRGHTLTTLVRVEDVQQQEETDWRVMCHLLQRVSKEEIAVLTGIPSAQP